MQHDDDDDTGTGTKSLNERACPTALAACRARVWGAGRDGLVRRATGTKSLNESARPRALAVTAGQLTLPVCPTGWTTGYACDAERPRSLLRGPGLARKACGQGDWQGSRRLRTYALPTHASHARPAMVPLQCGHSGRANDQAAAE